MKVTVCQIDPRASELDGYLAGLTDHIAANGSEFVLLPERPFSEWLAVDPEADPSRWFESINAHNRYTENLDALGARAVLGTRPIVNDTGSRRNEAFIWCQDTQTASGINEKYYLPNEEGYWEAAWYECGAKAFDTVRFTESVIGVQICSEMWFFE